ncbi:unnamed protein product [Sympodiomycopsis kandeliae]
MFETIPELTMSPSASPSPSPQTPPTLSVEKAKRMDHDLIYTSPTDHDTAVLLWPANAEQDLQKWKAAYNDAINRLRSLATAHDVQRQEMPLIGEGSMALIEKFLSSTHRRQPCLVLQSEPERGLMFLTGDPATCHHTAAQVFYSDTLLRMEVEHAHSYSEIAVSAGSPTWPINVRFPGKVSDKYFVIGTGIKEPDYAVWSSVTNEEATVVEVAYHNESSSQLFFEAILWSQQGNSPAPVKSPCNIVAIDIEEATTMRSSATNPAFALIIMTAAQQDGSGERKILLINGNERMLEKWRQIIEESHLPDTVVEHAAEVSLQFDFLCRFARSEWRGQPLILTLERLVSRFQGGLSRDSKLVELMAVDA